MGVGIYKARHGQLVTCKKIEPFPVVNVLSLCVHPPFRIITESAAEVLFRNITENGPTDRCMLGKRLG